MTKKKTSPIEEHKEQDVILMRKMLLGIIEDAEVTKKDRIEAAKLLARMHHTLQVDRQVSAIATANQMQAQVLTQEEEEKIKELLYDTKHSLPA